MSLYFQFSYSRVLVCGRNYKVSVVGELAKFVSRCYCCEIPVATYAVGPMPESWMHECAVSREYQLLILFCFVNRFFVVLRPYMGCLYNEFVVYYVEHFLSDVSILLVTDYAGQLEIESLLTYLLTYSLQIRIFLVLWIYMNYIYCSNC